MRDTFEQQWEELEVKHGEARGDIAYVEGMLNYVIDTTSKDWFKMSDVLRITTEAKDRLEQARKILR